MRSEQATTRPTRPDLGPLLERLWIAAVPIAGTPGEKYLIERGLEIPETTPLRYIVHTKHGPSGQWFPAILGAVRRTTGQLIALHRTFLDPQRSRKAQIEAPRLFLGYPEDRTVELAKAEPVMGIAEGIEKAMAATEIHGCPVWSAMSASRLAGVSIPEEVIHLRIFADRNPPGMIAAEKAAAIHARPGRTVTIEPPPTPWIDWDQLLLERKRSR